MIGLFGLTIPEEYGGQGLDMVSLAIVFEEISKAWMGIAGIIGSHSLACLMIARHGTDEQKRRPAARAGNRGTAYGHRPDRTERRQRPAGHLHSGMARR